MSSRGHTSGMKMSFTRKPKLPKFTSDPVETAFEHDLTHHLTRPEQPVLDRPQRQAGHFRDLVIAEIVRVPQQDQLLVRVRKPFYHLPDLGPPLADLAVLFRRGGGTFDLQLIRSIFVFGFEALRIYRIAAQVVDGRVVCDAVQPG